jgi:hypothetical protein
MPKRSDAAPDVDDAPSVPRRRSAPVGGGSDSDTEIEAPKKPRSAAQIAAFEKARERLAQSKAERAAASKPATPATPATPQPATPEQEQVQEQEEPAPPTTAPRTRKPRSDKGKRRGTLRRLSEDLEDTATSAPRSHSPYTSHGGWSLDGMYRRHGQFIVV